MPAEDLQNSNDLSTLTWLRKCRLLTSNNRITELGIVKLAESYPLTKQVEFLGLPLTVFRIKKNPALSPEGNAIQHLKANYEGQLILHDEGRRMGTVFYACILARYKKLLPFATCAFPSQFDDRKYLIGLDAWSFDDKNIEFVCAEVLSMNSTDFRKGFSLAVALHNEAQQDLSNRGLSDGVEFYLQLFENIGPELTCDLLRLNKNNHDLSFPDLSIIGDRGISFLEVKASDKLSFNQIYTFVHLKKLKEKHNRIGDLGVVRMIFEKQSNDVVSHCTSAASKLNLS